MSSAVSQLVAPSSLQNLRTWARTHVDRIAYGAIAVAMAVLVAAATFAGVLLHRSATIERQTLRTEGLAHAALTSVGQAQAAFALLEQRDPAEAARVAPAYRAYVRAPGSNAALLQLEQTLHREVQLQGASSRREFPRTRVALITAAVAALLLVALLVWQFELQRRAGRIDRDVAERLQEVVTLRDRFVASVSHELRTPLTSILGYLELLRESPDLNDDDVAYLEVMGRSSERLMRLVTDLLLVAEADGGGLALYVRPLELGALASDAVEAALPAAAERDVALVLERRRPVSLDGDRVRLAQVVDNLLSNAIKFTPAGGRVTVRVGGDTGGAVLEVADTGPGIPAAQRRHLFEPFYRASPDTPGTGLGLTITKAIVEAHRGSIAVESAWGSGTTFRVELPA